MNERILLGRLNADSGTYADGEVCYLTKHSWDCGWYWGFGYVGNKNTHFHFDSLMSPDVTYKASDLFKQTHISDSDWWVIRDLFKQAYALKAAASVYVHGGHQTHRVGVTDILKNADKAAALNKDLELLLDHLWNFVVNAATFKLEAQ